MSEKELKDKETKEVFGGRGVHVITGCDEAFSCKIDPSQCYKNFEYVACPKLYAPDIFK